MTTGSQEAVGCVSGALRGAPIAVPLREAQRGVWTGTATRLKGEESRPETPPTTGEEGMESGIAETTEREVGRRDCFIFEN